jgi:hypothetical protein
MDVPAFWNPAFRKPRNVEHPRLEVRGQIAEVKAAMKKVEFGNAGHPHYLGHPPLIAFKEPLIEFPVNGKT